MGELLELALKVAFAIVAVPLFFFGMVILFGALDWLVTPVEGKKSVR